MRGSTIEAVNPLPFPRELRGLLFRLSCWILLWLAPQARAAQPCASIDSAREHLHRSICVAAHIYDEIDLDDGTRILDVCGPEHTDSACNFAFASLPADRNAVGDLRRFVGTNVTVHGTVVPVRGPAVQSAEDRAEILIRSGTQLHSDRRSAHFQPNPDLLKEFSSAQNRPPVLDPAFRPGRRRSAGN